MPKQKQEDVTKLLTNMKGSAARAKSPRDAEQLPQAAAQKPDTLHRHIDLAPYKEHQGWPGRAYLLVGNSYNMERKNKANSAFNKKRSANIAALLEQTKGNRRCVSVEDALRHSGFVAGLSRFEFDWLRRQPGTSQVGPAYDQHGEHLPNSFAVWRVDAVQTKAGQAPKQLVGAK